MPSPIIDPPPRKSFSFFRAHAPSTATAETAGRKSFSIFSREREEIPIPRQQQPRSRNLNFRAGFLRTMGSVADLRGSFKSTTPAASVNVVETDENVKEQRQQTTQQQPHDNMKRSPGRLRKLVSTPVFNLKWWGRGNAADERVKPQADLRKDRMTVVHHEWRVDNEDQDKNKKKGEGFIEMPVVSVPSLAKLLTTPQQQQDPKPFYHIEEVQPTSPSPRSQPPISPSPSTTRTSTSSSILHHYRDSLHSCIIAEPETGTDIRFPVPDFEEMIAGEGTIQVSLTPRDLVGGNAVLVG